MNTISKADIVQWDIKTWAKAVDFWDKNIDWASIETALELGAREGGLSLWLAEKGIQTICSDYKNSEVTASVLHDKYGYTGKIMYQDIDATAIPYEEKFDLIVFKSIIGGIAKGDNKNIQQDVFNQIHKALKPGGVLLFAENLVSSPLHRKMRKRHNKWGDYWRYVTKDELIEFVGAFETVQIKTTGFLATLGRSEKQKKILGTADEFVFNHFTPKSWHYLGYGIARKAQ